MIQRFNAVYKKQGKWYLGWIEEVPGVNTQGRSLKEAKQNLKEALALILEVNRILLRHDIPPGNTIREPLTVNIK